MVPGIFLDRDGVIIENREGYIRSWSDVAFYPSALIALSKLSVLLSKIVIITNQAGIGHGKISQETADQINQRLSEEIAKCGGRIDRIYMCPHRPEDYCQCRKPRPGLILQAAEDLAINLDQSIFIGDNISDMLAGIEAGIRRLYLVRTGLGNNYTSDIRKLGNSSINVCENLNEALKLAGLIDE